MTPQDATSPTCPKCAAPMRSYERNRVLVEQCTGCGGLFLDRGELEALVAAEQAWHAGSIPGDAGRHDDRPRYDDRRHDDRYRHGRKKNSFLSELFDD
ncbi:zf-TFIIB domain-containing protein [Lapillicoccus jejuensis]|uniref:Transcription factor zinc-finger domain-containing protein n=1 Tax=Lapillicoccus jejuensis TaxID=402171 RepID=A0A542E3W8_9MICO|nr:zf-TFIIB domain-containing protein [Lapillicoccus jejuensis]TQJ10031.1 hypothetical protein FB458_3149 [Lapillicoccus jejuensis]